MTRTTREVNLSTRTSRAKLKATGKPYYRTIDEGLHLGYRKGVRGSTWVVRYYLGNQNYRTESLDARPDDVLEADGATVLTWIQAQAAARCLYQRVQRAAVGLDCERPKGAGAYTVKDAVDDYLTVFKAGHTKGGGKGEKTTVVAINAHLLPSLGSEPVDRLTKKRIQDWHIEIANSSPRLRTKTGNDQKFRSIEEDTEGTRRRKSTANRILTILKAVLNHAHQEGKVLNDDAWRLVKPFKEVDAARIRHLDDDEARRLVNASDPEFRPLVQSALLTGCRLGELTSLLVSDFNANSGTIHIRISKSGKPRHVYLGEEGKNFFITATMGKSSSDFVFTKPSDPLARIAALTGLDYAKLTALTVSDLSFKSPSENATLRVGERTMALFPAAEIALRRLAEGQDQASPLIPPPHFIPWGKSQQHRPFKAAVKAAQIEDLAFHELRHTYASRLVMKGVSLMVVAKQLGHTDTRMVEKHYGHMAPSYVADTIRAASTDIGIVEQTNVTSLRV